MSARGAADPFASLARHGLSHAAAERAARRIAGAGASLAAAHAMPIPHRVIRRTTDALFAVRLDVRAAAERAVAYDVVVKRMRAHAPDDDPHLRRFAPSPIEDHPNYWLREYEAYGSPLLAGLPPPLRAPACFERERDADGATVWLERASADPPRTWSDDRFAAIAAALGAWQGAFAARRDAASEPAWLARGTLAMWTPAPGGSAYAAAFRDDVLASPLAIEAFGRAGASRVRAIWSERTASLASLARVPQTLAHGDLWTRNLLARDDGGAPVVAIDWSELGIAPVAHDLVNLVLDSVWMFDVPPERIDAIERACVSAYAHAWAGAGGPAASSVEPAYRASARVRFGTLAGVLLAQAADERKRAAASERYERPYEAIFAARAAVARAAFARATLER